MWAGGKNALKLAYLQKTLLLIDSELELLNLKIRYPESFQQPEQPIFKSMLSLIPKSPNLGIMGLTEILTSLRLLEGIEDDTGKNPSIIAFSNIFEQAFGCVFNDIYDCQGELFKRKPCNLTKTLDAMKTALTKEYNKRKKMKMKKDALANA